MDNILFEATTEFKWNSDIQLNDREKFRFKEVKKYFVKGKLLDIGCRSGELRNFLPKEIQYYGLDFIEDYGQFIDNFYHLDVSKNKIPADDNSFEYVHLGEVLEHISCFMNVFEEIHRILKPNGLIVITVPNNFHLLQAISILHKHNYKKTRLDIEAIKHLDTHIHSLSEYDLLKICQLIGFIPFECDRFYCQLGKYKLPECTIFKVFAKFILFVARKKGNSKSICS